MLWVSGHWKYVDSYSAGIDISPQNLTSVHKSDSVDCRRLNPLTKVDPRTVRVDPFYLAA